MKEKMPLVCSDDYGKDEAGAQVCSLLLMISFKKIFFKQLSSHWDFSHGKFGLLSLGKGSCDRVAPPNLPCILVVFFIFHQTPTLTTGSLMCAQMLMQATAHGGVQTPLQSLH